MRRWWKSWSRPSGRDRSAWRLEALGVLEHRRSSFGGREAAFVADRRSMAEIPALQTGEGVRPNRGHVPLMTPPPGPGRVGGFFLEMP